jgi:hypothetical protein
VPATGIFSIPISAGHSLVCALPRTDRERNIKSLYRSRSTIIRFPG